MNDRRQAELAGRLGSTFLWENDGRDHGHLAIHGTVAHPDGSAANNGSQDNEARFRHRAEARSVNRWLHTGRIAGADRYTMVGMESLLNLGPVQVGGGVGIPPESYGPAISDIGHRYQILLVADEVICGFGRTGKWFGSDYYKIQPDLMPIAKGLSSGYLPIAAVMVADHVARVLIEEGGELFHGMTYSGHPAACAVACANIRILRDEGIISKVETETGPYLQKRWRALGDHPLVGEARGVGFLGALELVADKRTRRPFDTVGEVGSLCRDACRRRGLALRQVGAAMTTSPPPTLINEDSEQLI